MTPDYVIGERKTTDDRLIVILKDYAKTQNGQLCEELLLEAAKAIDELNKDAKENLIEIFDLKRRCAEFEVKNSTQAIDSLAKSGIDVHIRRIMNGEITVCLADTFIKDGCLLEGTSGRGNTVEQAATDYLEKIKNRPLVINPNKRSRAEIMFI